MWTFLGIATFTYFYKKCGDVTLANKELLLCVLVFLSLGLVLSYRCRHRHGGLLGRHQSGAQFAAFSDILSALPLIGFFWAKSPESEKKEQLESKKCRKEIGLSETTLTGAATSVSTSFVTDPEVIIVGSGVLGSALAAVLSRDGRKVTVIERDLKEPDRIVGELLQPGGYRVLQELGLGGVLILGDAYNLRHPLTGGGMTVALKDIKLWRQLLKDIPDLYDDAAIFQAKKSFFWSRKRTHSFVVNVLAQALYELFSATDVLKLFEVEKKRVSRLSVYQDVELSAPPASCLPANCHAPCLDDNELNLGN